MWLSGPTQWEDHLIGKKHRRNLRGWWTPWVRARRAEEAMKFLALLLASKFLREQRYRDEKVHIKAGLGLAKKVLKENNTDL